LWALATLKLPTDAKQDGTVEVLVPLEKREQFAGQETIHFRFEGGDHPTGSELESLRLGSPLGARILTELRQLGPVVHAAPTARQASVPEITTRLFQAYTVQGGSARLGGCSLEDRPLLRYTYSIGRTGSDLGPRLVHVYASPDGRPIDEDLLSALGARELAPVSGRPPRVSSTERVRWRNFGEQHAPIAADGEQCEFLLATTIWCKYAQGKVLFEIGENRAETEFQGWAKLLVDGTTPPPMFRCPETGLESYEVLALDDGRITVPEAVTVCEESGRRVLTTDLEACCVTNRHVLPEHLHTCPVCGDRLLQSVMVSCAGCREQVSPHCVRDGRCAACRSMESVRKDDPRLARVLGEYERLDRWRRWRLSETSQSYILSAHSLLRRLLIVLNKESLLVTHLADAGRFSSNWIEVPETRRRDYLG
jgi:hypothetical protein